MVMQRLDELAQFSAEHDALTRLYLAVELKAAALQTQAWMQAAGMAAHVDAVGNVVGRYEGREPGLPAVMLGSHIDTVRDAGKYDGCFGVIAAIQAVATLHEANERLPFAGSATIRPSVDGFQPPAGGCLRIQWRATSRRVATQTLS
jgi:allantoate deiminase